VTMRRSQSSDDLAKDDVLAVEVRRGRHCPPGPEIAVFWLLSALRAHTKAHTQSIFSRKTLRVLSRPKAARTAEEELRAVGPGPGVRHREHAFVCAAVSVITRTRH
jgi:hypothetical protein